MYKALLLLFFVTLTSAGKAQDFDTVQVRASVLSSPFDSSPRQIDTLMLVVNQFQETCGLPLDTVPVSEAMTKCAQRMGVDATELGNGKIYEFVEKWLGTPYRYGGNTQKGIDCSGLTRELYGFISDVILPRSSREMYASDLVETLKDKDVSALKEGDLLFFRSKGRIYHVAVYLCEGKFLSANRSGVEISDLNEPYWKKHFYSAARVKEAVPVGEKLAVIN